MSNNQLDQKFQQESQSLLQSDQNQLNLADAHQHSIQLNHLPQDPQVSPTDRSAQQTTSQNNIPVSQMMLSKTAQQDETNLQRNQQFFNKFDSENRLFQPGGAQFDRGVYKYNQQSPQMIAFPQNMPSSFAHFEQMHMQSGQTLEPISGFQNMGEAQPHAHRLQFDPQQQVNDLHNKEQQLQLQALQDSAKIVQIGQHRSESDDVSVIPATTQQFRVESNQIGQIEQSEQLNKELNQYLQVPSQPVQPAIDMIASMGETSQDCMNKMPDQSDFTGQNKSSCGIMTEGKETQQSSDVKVAAGSDLNFVSSQHKKIPQTDQVVSGQPNNSSQYTHEDYNQPGDYNNIIYSESVNKFSECQEFDPPDSLSNFPQNPNFAQINDLLDDNDEDVHLLNIKNPSKINSNKVVEDAESLVSSKLQANSTKQTNGSNLIKSNIQQPQRGQSSCENQPPLHRLQLKPPGTGSGGNCGIFQNQNNAYFQDNRNHQNIQHDIGLEYIGPQEIGHNQTVNKNIMVSVNQQASGMPANVSSNIRHPSMDSRQPPQPIETTRGVGVVHGIGYYQADQIIKQSSEFNNHPQTIVVSGRKSVHSNQELQKNNFFKEESQLHQQPQSSLVPFGKVYQQNDQSKQIITWQDQQIPQQDLSDSKLNQAGFTNKEGYQQLEIESPVRQSMGRSLNLSGLKSQDNFQGQRSENTVRERRMTADEHHLLENSSNHLGNVVKDQQDNYQYPQSAERKQDEFAKKIITSVSEDNNQRKQNARQPANNSLQNRYQAQLNTGINMDQENNHVKNALIDQITDLNKQSNSYQIAKDQTSQNQQLINSNRIVVDDPQQQQELEYCMAEIQQLKQFNRNKLDQQVQHRIMMSNQGPHSHQQFTYRVGAPLAVNNNSSLALQHDQQIQLQYQKLSQTINNCNQIKANQHQTNSIKLPGQLSQLNINKHSLTSNQQIKEFQIQQAEIKKQLEWQHQQMVQNQYYKAQQQLTHPAQAQKQLSVEEHQMFQIQNQWQHKLMEYEQAANYDLPQSDMQAQLMAQMNQLHLDQNHNQTHNRGLTIDQTNYTQQSFGDQSAQQTQIKLLKNIDFYPSNINSESTDSLQHRIQSHYQNQNQILSGQVQDGSIDQSIDSINWQSRQSNMQRTLDVYHQHQQHMPAFYPQNSNMANNLEQTLFKNDPSEQTLHHGLTTDLNDTFDQKTLMQQQILGQIQNNFQVQQQMIGQWNQMQHQQSLVQNNSGNISSQELQISKPSGFKALQQMVAQGQADSAESVGGQKTVVGSNKTSITDGQQPAQRQKQYHGNSNDLSINLSDHISPQKNNQTEQPNELTNVLSSSRSSQHVLSEERPDSAKAAIYGGKCTSQKYSARNQINSKILGSIRGEASYGSRDHSKGIIKGATSHGAASDDGKIHFSSHSHYDSQTSKEKNNHNKNVASKSSNLKGSVKTVNIKASSQKNQSDGNKRKDSMNKGSSGHGMSQNAVQNDIPKYKEILQTNKLIQGGSNLNDAKSMNDKILQSKTSGCEDAAYQRKNSVKSGGNQPMSSINLNQNLDQLNQKGSNVLSSNNSNYGRKQSYSQGDNQNRNAKSNQRMQLSVQTAQANSGQHGSNQSYDEFIQQIQRDIKMAMGDSEKEFNVLNGNILKITSKKVGSLFLQDHLKNADQQLINKIIDQVDGQLADLMVGRFGNFFYNKLIEYLQPHQRIHFLRQISGKQFVEISCHEKGTWALQNILRAAIQEEEYKIIEETIMRNDNISKLSKDKQGHHIINLIITSYPDSIRRQLFNYICNNFKELAQDQNGLCVMKEIIKYARKDIDMQKQIVNNIIVDSLEYVQHEFGNFVVQEIINLYDFELCKGIYKQMEGHFYRLSLNKFSSKLIETCIDRAPLELQDQIVKEFCNSNCLSKVVQGNFGNFVLQKSIEKYLKSEHNKLELIKAIINCLEEVSDYKVQDKWGHQLLVRYLNQLESYPQHSQVSTAHIPQQEYQEFVQQKRSVRILLEQKMSEIDHQHQLHKQNIQNQMQGGRAGNFGSSQGNRGNNGNSFTSKFNNQGRNHGNATGNNYINSKHNQKLNKTRGGANKSNQSHKHNHQKNLQLQQQHSAQPKQQYKPLQAQQRYSLNQIIQNDQMGNYFDTPIGADSSTEGGHLYQQYQGKNDRNHNQFTMQPFSASASVQGAKYDYQTMSHRAVYHQDYDYDNNYHANQQQFRPAQHQHRFDQGDSFGYSNMETINNESNSYGHQSHVNSSQHIQNENAINIMSDAPSAVSFNNSGMSFANQQLAGGKTGSQQMQFMARGNQQKHQMRQDQFAQTQQYSFRGQQQSMSSQSNHHQFYNQANNYEMQNAQNDSLFPIQYQQKGKNSQYQGVSGQITKVHKSQNQGANGNKAGFHGRQSQRVSGSKKQIVKMSDITWATKQEQTQGGDTQANDKHPQIHSQVQAPTSNPSYGMPMHYTTQNSTPNLGSVATSRLLPQPAIMEHTMSHQQIEQNNVPSSLFNNDPLGITPNGSSGGTTGRETENQLE